MNRVYIYALMFSGAVYSAELIAKDQNMSGIQIGGGISVSFDKNEFNTNVANQVKSVSAQAGADVTSESDISPVVNGLWGYNESKNATAAIDVGTITGVISKDTSITVTPFCSNNTDITYYTGAKQAKMNKVGLGVELKLAYFHDFNNGIMVGIDAACAFSPKKKHVIRPGQMDAHPDLNVNFKETSTDSEPKDHTFTWNGKEYEGGSTKIAGSTELKLSPKISGFEATIGQQTEDPTKYLYSYVAFDEKHDKYGEITVENKICSPRGAIVLGLTADGLFAGIRGGVSYEKLNVSVNGGYYDPGNGFQPQSGNKSLSITAPFVGIQIVKQVSVGVNDAQFYFTADRAIGNDEKDVNVCGVKKIKRNRYNLSAGVTWKLKL